MAVTLDSGTPYMYLPKEVAQSFIDMLGARPFTNGNGYYVDCNMGSAGSLTFDFSGAQIKVPVSELLLVLEYDNGNPVVEDGIQYCIVAVGSTGEGRGVILGDAFLRSAYVVYDLENYQVALAQAAYGSSGTNIEAVLSDIPSASQAPSFSSSSLWASFSYSFSDIFQTPATPAPSVASTVNSSPISTPASTSTALSSQVPGSTANSSPISTPAITALSSQILGSTANTPTAAGSSTPSTAVEPSYTFPTIETSRSFSYSTVSFPSISGLTESVVSAMSAALPATSTHQAAGNGASVLYVPLAAIAASAAAFIFF
jgi:yapsin 1